MAKVYLVDSSIYVFQAWFSLPDSLTNVQGEPNNAWVGFTDFVYRFLTAERPRKLVFAFDESLRSSARNDIYPEYKANRAPAPEALKRQFQWCRGWLDALGIAQVASDRHEADDLIGSLARFNREQGDAITILTADKDLAQLIGENDTWWSYAAGQQLNYRSVIKRFGVKPGQIADQLALAGDKVDNIPGIPGIGMTIAARLLTRFDTLTNLRANVERVGEMKFRGAQRVMKLLQEHDAILDISSRLTPIDCDIEAMRGIDPAPRKADPDQLERIMQEQRMGAERRSKWREWVDKRPA
jgi:5'-3' exonuclease